MCENQGEGSVEMRAAADRVGEDREIAFEPLGEGPGQRNRGGGVGGPEQLGGVRGVVPYAQPHALDEVVQRPALLAEHGFT